MKRGLIVSGCSYSKYYGLTYADYLSTSYDFYYNVGCGGSGNNSIFIKFLEFANENPLTEIKVDVIIQWSSILRVDQYENTNLTHQNDFAYGGVIFHNQNYSPGYIKKHFNINYQIRMLSNYIFVVREICKNRGWNLKMTHMLEPWIGDFYGEPGFKNPHNETILNIKKQLTPESKKLLKKIQSTTLDLTPMESIEMFCLGNKKKHPIYYQDAFSNNVEDDHPSSYQHFLYASKFSKFLDINLPLDILYKISNQITKLQESKNGIQSLYNLSSDEILRKFKFPRNYRGPLI